MALNAGGFLAGSIIAQMFLDTKGWKTGIDQIKKDSLTIKNTAAQIGGALKTGFTIGAAAMTAVAGTLGAIAKVTANAGDEFNDMAKRTGIAVEDLSAFELMAQKCGTSIEGMAVGFRGLSSRMLDAARGIPATKAVFDELGISVSDGNGKLRSMKDVLLDVADRFSKMEDGTRKAALAQDLFGRSGMDLIPMLNEGRAAILANTEAAERLGLVWSKADAAAADLFNDSLAELSGAFRGIRNDLGKELIPVITTLVQSATEGVATIRKHISDLAKSGKLHEWAVGLAKIFVTSFKYMVKAVEGLVLIWQFAQGVIFKGGEILVQIFTKWAVNLFAVLNIAAKIVPGLKGVQKEVAILLVQMVTVSQEYNKLADQKFEKASDILVSFDVLNKEIDKIIASLDKPPNQMEAIGKTADKFMPGVIGNFNVLASAIEDATEGLTLYQKIYGEQLGKIIGEKKMPFAWQEEGYDWEADLNASFDAINNKAKETGTAVKATVDNTKNYFDGLYNDIAQGFSSAFQGMLEGTQTFAEGFSNIWKSIKAAFFRILGEMVAGFFVKFISKIVSGMGIIKALSSALGIGKIVGGVAGGAAAGAGAGGAAASSIIGSWAIPVAFAAAWLGTLFGNLFGKSAADKWEDAYTAKMKKKYGADWIPHQTVIDRSALTQPDYAAPINWTGKRRHGTETPSGSATPKSGDINVNLTVSAMDGADVVTVVKKKVIPILKEAARRREFSVPMGAAGGV